MNIRKYWIKKNREESFLLGVIAVCIIAGFVTNHWSRSDRLSVRPEIKVKFEKLSKERQKRLLKEVALSQPTKSNKQFYHLDNKTKQVVPKLFSNETQKKSKKQQ